MDVERPAGATTRVEYDDTGLTLVRRAGSWAAGCAPGVCLTLLTFFCVILFHGVWAHFSWHLFLFGLPFWSSWLFFVCWLAWILLGRERLTIGPEGLEYVRWAGVELGRRTVGLDEVTGISRFTRNVGGESGGTELGLQVDTIGRPIRFGQGITYGEWEWQARLLKADLERWRRGREVPIDWMTQVATVVEWLQPGQVGREPPPGSSIQLESDWEATRFIRPGRFELANLGAATFPTLFVNSIVGFFLYLLTREFQWFLCLYLILFGLVGLTLIVAWFSVLLAPFGRREWAVGRDDITVRSTLLGIGGTRYVDPDRVACIALCKNVRNRSWYEKLGPDREFDARPFALVLVGRGSRDRVLVDDLTEDEARWMGVTLCNLLRHHLKDDAPGETAPGETLWDREMDG
jgi:hypothetical protein